MNSQDHLDREHGHKPNIPLSMNKPKHDVAELLFRVNSLKEEVIISNQKWQASEDKCASLEKHLEQEVELHIDSHNRYDQKLKTMRNPLTALRTKGVSAGGQLDVINKIRGTRGCESLWSSETQKLKTKVHEYLAETKNLFITFTETWFEEKEDLIANITTITSFSGEEIGNLTVRANAIEYWTLETQTNQISKGFSHVKKVVRSAISKVDTLHFVIANNPTSRASARFQGYTRVLEDQNKFEHTYKEKYQKGFDWLPDITQSVDKIKLEQNIDSILG